MLSSVFNKIEANLVENCTERFQFISWITKAEELFMHYFVHDLLYDCKRDEIDAKITALCNIKAYEQLMITFIKEIYDPIPEVSLKKIPWDSQILYLGEYQQEIDFFNRYLTFAQEYIKKYTSANGSRLLEWEINYDLVRYAEIYEQQIILLC